VGERRAREGDIEVTGEAGVPRGAYGAFADLTREHGFEPLRVEGQLPTELRGTLYRCGPATRSCQGHPYRHLFDGDGAVTAIRFDGGSVHGAVRMVATPGLLAERAAGKALFPAYGTLPPGPPRPLPRPKHAANISVLASADRVLALHEAGAPIELTGELHTVGENDLGEPSIRHGFSAHPHWVAARAAHYNIGVHYGPTTRLALYELRDAAARRFGTVELAGPTMIHDVAVTERHIVVFAPPLRLDLRAFATGLVSYSDALQWRPELGTEVIVIPIDDPASVIRFTIDPFFQWHLAAAHERGDEIVVDVVRYPDFTSNRWIGALPGGLDTPHAPGCLARATIDRTRRTATLVPASDVSLEFPVVDTHDPGRIFAIAHSSSAPNGPFDRIVGVDLATGGVRDVELPPGHLPTEPIHVPGPDGGWLLSLVYDAASTASHVAVIDASTLGVVARAWFDHHIPFTLHGAWVAG
jgi:carotenoid cleavage dioxygenase-like enzyme